MRGTLPSYIVNLDEFAQALSKAWTGSIRLDSGVQKYNSFKILNGQSITWRPTEDITLTEIMITAEKYRFNQYENIINITVDGIPLIEDMRQKEAYNSKTFMRPYSISRGSRVVMSYNSTDSDYAVIDIGYFEEILIKEVIIECYYGEDLVDTKFYYYRPPSNVTITPPELEGYVSEDSPVDLSLSANSPDSQTIKFYYKEEFHIKAVTVFHKLSNGEIIEEEYYEFHEFTEITFYAKDFGDGYNLLSDSEYFTIIDNDSPAFQEVEFFYDKQDVVVDNEYDHMIKLFWQPGVSTDLDLHVTLFAKDGTRYEVSYRDRNIKHLDGEAWLNYDYTSRYDTSSFREKPEIVTILGAVWSHAVIEVNPYSGYSELTQDAEVEWTNEHGKVLGTWKIPVTSLRNGSKFTLPRIDL